MLLKPLFYLFLYTLSLIWDFESYHFQAFSVFLIYSIALHFRLELIWDGTLFLAWNHAPNAVVNFCFFTKLLGIHRRLFLFMDRGVHQLRLEAKFHCFHCFSSRVNAAARKYTSHKQWTSGHYSHYFRVLTLYNNRTLPN